MRRHPQIDARDPVAFAGWLAELRPVVADIRALTCDATAPKGHRRHARSHLRELARRRFQMLTLLLAAIDPAASACATGQAAEHEERAS